MMPGSPQVIQVVCVVAIGLGAGLFAAGHYLEPPMAAMTPADLQRFWSGNDDAHIAASALRGVGICLLTMGGLGIVIPWINTLVFRASSPASHSTLNTQPSTKDNRPLEPSQ